MIQLGFGVEGFFFFFGPTTSPPSSSCLIGTFFAVAAPALDDEVTAPEADTGVALVLPFNEYCLNTA